MLSVKNSDSNEARDLERLEIKEIHACNSIKLCYWIVYVVGLSFIRIEQKPVRCIGFLASLCSVWDTVRMIGILGFWV